MCRWSGRKLFQRHGAVFWRCDSIGANDGCSCPHHPPQRQKGRLPGLQFFAAAVDTHLSLERSKDSVKLMVEKQREAKEPMPMMFKTLGVLIGQDEDQRESIVFELQDIPSEEISLSVSHLSQVEKSVLQALATAFPPEGASTSQLVKACHIAGIEERTYRRTRNKLVELGAITIKTKEGKQVSNSEFAGSNSQQSKTCLYSVNYNCEWCKFLSQDEEEEEETDTSTED